MQLYFILLTIGLALVTLLTIGGAIASRKFNFNYNRISTLSVLLYLTVSMVATRMIDASAGITIVGLLGLYEAVFAWKWVFKFEANFKGQDEDIKAMFGDNYAPPPWIVLMVVCFYLFIGWIGTLLA
jgi:hypothetical protein